MNQPDKTAKGFGVEIVSFEKTNPTNTTLFPDRLIDRFRLGATWHDYSKTTQRERDAMSVAFVMRRRQGAYASDVLDCSYVLVTRNSTFTRYAQTFVRTNLAPPDFAFGPTIETKTLAAIVWVKFGSTASSELPQIHLISACDRILASNRELLRRAEKRLNESEGIETASALLTSHQAVLDLVISVGGSPDVLDSADGAQLLQAFSTSAEERGRNEERLKAEREKALLASVIAERERDVQSLDNKARLTSAEKTTLETRLKAAQNEVAAAQIRETKRIYLIAERLERESGRTASLMTSIFWVITTLYTAYGQFFIWDATLWNSGKWHDLAWNFSVILATLIATAMGMRFLGVGQLDLANVMQRKLRHYFLLIKLSRIDPMEEQNAVRDELERSGWL